MHLEPLDEGHATDTKLLQNIKESAVRRATENVKDFEDLARAAGNSKEAFEDMENHYCPEFSERTT
jgi:hypothetical protein